ncbi:hypothetical protein NMG60_11027270 [Bertholletia excelsa]
MSCTVKSVSKLCNWGRSFKHGAKVLCFSRSRPGYSRLGHDLVEPEPLPKGHLAVYVDQQEDDAQRYLMLVIYFNHPLFEKLLRETEEYEFNYPGGIQIPCQVFEFENVRTRIAAARTGYDCRGRRSWRLQCFSGRRIE